MCAFRTVWVWEQHFPSQWIHLGCLKQKHFLTKPHERYGTAPKYKGNATGWVEKYPFYSDNQGIWSSRQQDKRGELTQHELTGLNSEVGGTEGFFHEALWEH